MNSDTAFRQRFIVGAAFEDVLKAHYESRGATVTCPVENNGDNAIPGTPGYFVPERGRSGLDRPFIPLVDMPPERRKYATPAFWLSSGPVIAPDFRIEDKKGGRFVEAKTTAFVRKAILKGHLYKHGVIGWRLPYTQSYRALVECGVHLDLELLLYWPSYYRSSERPRRASKSWGLYRFPPAVLQSGFLPPPSNYQEREAEFLPMRLAKRQSKDLGLDLARKTYCKIKQQDIDPLALRVGSDVFVGRVG